MTTFGRAIRPFAEADLLPLQAIRAAAFAPVFEAFRRIVGGTIAGPAFGRAEAEQAALLGRICAPGSGWRILIAMQAAAPRGFVAFSMDLTTGLGEIGLNAVHPDSAGRGIGAALYNAALAEMGAAGMRAVAVSTGGDPSHAPARRAYEKVGFGSPLPSVTLYREL